MFSVRKSKFRHVFGQPLKRDQCYDNVRITKNSWDSTYCAINPKYVAIITEAAGGGCFLVLPLAKVGRVERDCAQVAGHKSAVLDIAWCPHNDDVIASASDDCTVKVWQIPDGGLTSNLTEPTVDLVAHNKKVGCVTWHPSAHNILVSGGHDNCIIVWNVGSEQELLQIEISNIPYCLSFNYDGSKLACTCKDKTLKIFDPRSGNLLKEKLYRVSDRDIKYGDAPVHRCIVAPLVAGVLTYFRFRSLSQKLLSTLKEKQCHAGAKPSMVKYLKGGLLFTTGFSRMSERQYALWDEKDLSNPKTIQELDNSNGVMFPLYDVDTSMIYIVGKGDSQIRFFEVTDEEPYVHYLNTFLSKDSGRGVGFMPKRGLNVNNCEIARVYKLHNSGLCEVIPFTVPRKSELFQTDIYPDTASDTPALTAEEWSSGKNADPVLVSLQEGFVPTRKEALKVSRKSNVLDKIPQRQSLAMSSQSANSEAAAAAVLPPTVKLPDGFNPSELMDEIKKLKATVKTQEKQICELERRVDALEAAATSEEEVKEEVQQEEQQEEDEEEEKVE